MSMPVAAIFLTSILTAGAQDALETLGAPVELEDGRLKLKVLLDVSSVEVFANGGEKVITALVFPNEVTRPMEFWSENAEQKVRRFTAWKMQAAVPIVGEKVAR